MMLYGLYDKDRLLLNFPSLDDAEDHLAFSTYYRVSYECSSNPPRYWGLYRADTSQGSYEMTIIGEDVEASAWQQLIS